MMALPIVPPWFAYLARPELHWQGGVRTHEAENQLPVIIRQWHGREHALGSRIEKIKLYT